MILEFKGLVRYHISPCPGKARWDQNARIAPDSRAEWVLPLPDDGGQKARGYSQSPPVFIVSSKRHNVIAECSRDLQGYIIAILKNLWVSISDLEELMNQE
jgi:hypothetical protein